jgi:hypothetical protein
MKRSLPRALLFLTFLALPLSVARASFHLWDMSEVYSNSDGSVQFIEFFTTSGGQQFLTGHTLSFDIGSVAINSITFGSDLPGDSANKTFLVGTANLSGLYGVTPDYIIPANFLAQGSNNFINFASGTDKVNLTNLPLDGVQSLDGKAGVDDFTAAGTAVNSFATPKNFAGATATIPEPSTVALLWERQFFLVSGLDNADKKAGVQACKPVFPSSSSRAKSPATP